MRKKYTSPEVEALIFEAEDIIMVSGEFDKYKPVAEEETEQEEK